MAPAADLRVRIGETGDAASDACGRGGGHVAASRFPRPPDTALDILLISAALVAVAEIGDKTQLLAIILAARFRRPGPILLGILVATLLNHAAAAALGVVVGRFLSGPGFQMLVGAGFVAMALWALIPDKEDEGAAARTAGGVFLTTLVAFFLVEIGDKTQIATTLLGARYQNVALVAAGTTLGMMAANTPAVLLGEAATRVLPLRVVRAAAAVLFAALGAWILISVFLRSGFSF
jgi:putative Ca2+/H+ antiporter (TMEM165/GDT1 family)